MGGRPRVVGLLAAVAVVLFVSQLATTSLRAQMLVPLFGGNAKPKVVQKKQHFRPTLPYRNPMRVTAGISASADAAPQAENSEVSAAVGASSSASVTVALAETASGGSTAAASPGPESPDSPKSSDTQASQSEASASPQNSATPSEADTTPASAAADEDAPAAAGDDAASDTTSGSTPDDAKDDATPAAEAAEAPEAPQAVEAPSAPEAEQAADEPAAAPDEAEQTAEAPGDEAPPDEAPRTPAETAASPTEDDAAAPTAATEAADDTTPAASTPATETPAEPAESVQTTASTDANADTETAKPAAKPPYTASVVLEVSPPPDAPLDAAADETPSPATKETQTAALTPPAAPVPDEVSPPDEETPAAAEAEPDSDAADSDKSAETPDEDAVPPAAGEDAEPSRDSAEPAAAEPAEAEPEVAQAPADPVVAEIRAKLADPSVQKHVSATDLKALEEFYGAHEGAPLWVTDAGFTDKARAVIAEIGKADDWGLEASAFDLPPANDLLATQNALADDELQLSIAILKYARYAQVGRLTPSQASPLFDQHPAPRNPKTVLTEIAAASAPDTYLSSLHPQDEQFKRLHQALLKARERAKANGTKPANDRDVQLIVINMERWRWLPRSLGTIYVWDNVPEFNTRVVKNGKTIYVEKTIVGQLKYATPLFSAPMRNIVFHPNWTVPPTIVNEDLAPALQEGGGLFGNSNTAILRNHGLSVSFKGQPVDPDTVDWKNVNIRTYTFTQDPGPDNVLGQLKFNFPNRHAIYMHDTVQPELFAETIRALSHGCIRVHDPDQFAAVLLGQDKGWSISQVRGLLAKRETSVISLNRHIPVHITYFTAVVDENGTVNKLGDIYGIDNRMAQKMFANPARFPIPVAPDVEAASNQSRSRQASGGLDNLISGLFGN